MAHKWLLHVTHTYIYIYIYANAYAWVAHIKNTKAKKLHMSHMNIWIYTYMRTHVHEWHASEIKRNVFIYIYIYIYIYLCIHIYTYIYTYIYIYIYTHIYKPRPHKKLNKNKTLLRKMSIMAQTTKWSNVTHMNESWRKCEWVVLQVWTFLREKWKSWPSPSIQYAHLCMNNLLSSWQLD